MKKLLLILMTALLLAGCAPEPVYETVSDTPETVPAVQQHQLLVQLPQEAAADVLEDENGGKLYHCDGYTLSVQTFPAGDLEKTVQSVSGHLPRQLTVLETAADFGKRYDFVWTAAGESGLQLGRACVLTDANHHYVLTAMAPEEHTGNLKETWDDLFSTCRLTQSGKDLNTGS